MGKDSHQRPGVNIRRFWQQRPAFAFLWVIILALLMAGAQHGLTYWRSATTRLPGACWIWAADAGQTPSAFFAAREFELTEALAVHAEGRLAIIADESYVVFLNGHYLGANSYHQAAAIDTYDVSGLLRQGRNRILVQLRSQRGVGGLLADLRVSDASSIDQVRPILVSDDSWQIFRRHHPMLSDLDTPLTGGEPADVWQLSPTGRWRPSGELTPRPLLPRQKKQKRLSPWRMRSPHNDHWIDLKRPRRHRPYVGAEILFDWGRVVEGLLYFDLPSTDTPPALIYFGDEPPDRQQVAPDHILIPMPGIDQWRDLHPRRFRYVLLVGVEPKSRIIVRAVDSELTEQLGPPPLASGGVFGLRPALRHTSVEEMIWKRISEETRARQQHAEPAQVPSAPEE